MIKPSFRDTCIGLFMTNRPCLARDFVCHGTSRRRSLVVPYSPSTCLRCARRDHVRRCLTASGVSASQVACTEYIYSSSSLCFAALELHDFRAGRVHGCSVASLKRYHVRRFMRATSASEHESGSDAPDGFRMPLPHHVFEVSQLSRRLQVAIGVP